MNRISNLALLLCGAGLMFLAIVVMDGRAKRMWGASAAMIPIPHVDDGVIWRPGIDPVATVQPARGRIVSVPFYSDHGPGRAALRERERTR